MSVPISASMVPYRTFCASQPMVLNARVTPIAPSPEEVTLWVVASMAEVFMASSDTLPLVVVTVLLVM